MRYRWVCVLVATYALAATIWPVDLHAANNAKDADAKSSETSSSYAPGDAITHVESEAEIEKQEQSQRAAGVVPMFGVTDRQNAPPMTAAQKFHLAWKGSFDPFEFASIGLTAAMSQANDEFPAYGQGTAGYSKRFGAALTDDVSSQFFSNFFYPTLLKEDPRYFRLGHGTLRRRVGYALVQEFIARRDRGGIGFNYSNVFGAVTTGALANAYYPPSERGAELTMGRAGVALIGGSLGGLMSEFWEDIQNKISKKRHHSESSNPSN